METWSSCSTVAVNWHYCILVGVFWRFRSSISCMRNSYWSQTLLNGGRTLWRYRYPW
jgi:hypothetical protein